ncbi:UNVERIFIED_CONTAM: Large T antigen [Trichonephila clavipes]
MDDVKGRKSEAKDKMSEGNGFLNLDNMRFYLDGTMPVQIEKKNEKPINIHFPPGLITCNNYVIPHAVKEIVKFFRFTSVKELYKKHQVKLSKCTIFIGGVLLDLLPVQPDVRDHIIDLNFKWWREHNGVCKCHLKENEGAIPKNDAAHRQRKTRNRRKEH